MKTSKLFLVIVLTLFSACAARTPVTPGTIPVQQNVDPGDEAYGERVLHDLKKSYPISSSARLHQRVRAVVLRLADAAGAGTHPWHVYVLQDDNMLNAAATRGNHVFVWTGLLKLVSSDDELAAVVGHEIGHVLAQHTMPTPGEQVNQVLVGTAGVAANSALGPGAGGFGGQLASMLAQALLVNPESQRVELEADHIGLFLMARAGYNPRAAVTLWKKMADQAGGASDGTLAFLSTHPPNQDRIEQLEQLMPQALQSSGLSSPDTGARDSFNRKTTTAPPEQQAQDSFNLRQDYQPGSGVEIWRVEEDFTPVFMKADSSSRVKTHIFYGTEVAVRKQSSGWLEIEHPTRGFVRGRDLAPK